MRPGPRHVRLSAAGAVILLSAGAFVAGSVVAYVAIHQRAVRLQRQAALFASDGVNTTARVIEIRRQGESNARVHYSYTVGGESYRGSTSVRRRESDRYAVGGDVNIRYLRPTPSSSWISAHGPRSRSATAAVALPIGATAAFAAVVWVIRRQWRLLEYGRPATATVTAAEKRKSDRGTYWRVSYEWTLLSGARRRGRFTHAQKTPPDVGTHLVVVHDRDEPSRHRRYPLPFVTLSRG